MDIEHLNKTQIILLTLLVSFVTSIATGIVTVSLLAQAPPAVTQTINRIVERTIEKATPSPAGSVKETTVVVKEDDLITDSISKSVRSLVRVEKPVLLDSGDTVLRVIGLGVILNGSGLIAMDAGSLESDTAYSAVLADGTTVPLKIISWNGSYPTALGMLNLSAAPKGYALSSATLGDPKSVKLGQSVLALSGATRQSVTTGIVGSLVIDSSASTTPASPPILFIDTTIPGNSLLPGSPLINIFGEIIGISTVDSRHRDAASFTPSAVLSAQIQQTKAKSAESFPSASTGAPTTQSASAGSATQ